MGSQDDRIMWVITLVAFILGVLIGSLLLSPNSRESWIRPIIAQRTIDGAAVTRGDFIKERIAEAESIWQHGVEMRHKTEIERPTVLSSPWTGSAHTLIWDLFYPTFNCPHLVERLGRVGDGGKWVCGVSHLAKHAAKNCVVYSYGVAGDTSFEQDILSRTNCTLRAFDYTIDPQNVELIVKYPKRSTFDKIGLGSNDKENFRTLKSEMTKHGDKFIDILKVDIEGGEFEVFHQVMKDFPEGLPFGQLLIEIHLNGMKDSTLYIDLKKWWEGLENGGLRPFFREPNLFFPPVKLFEYSFLNVKVNHRLLYA